MASKQFIITAGTEMNAPVYWARPEGHPVNHEPDLLLRLCDFVQVLHGEALLKFAEIMFMIAQRTETALFIEKEEGRFIPLVFTDDETKIPYHCLWYSYRDCVLLMLQIHYHYMACALKQKTDHNDTDLFMTRVQLIARAKQLYPMEPAHRTLVKLDQLELRTSQILQTFFPLESAEIIEQLRHAHDRRMRYLAATHQIMAVLVKENLMYINMVIAFEPSRINQPLATTFLSVMLEGHYVYHLSDKQLYLSKVQRDAGTRLSALYSKGEIGYRIHVFLSSSHKSLNVDAMKTHDFIFDRVTLMAMKMQRRSRMRWKIRIRRERKKSGVVKESRRPMRIIHLQVKLYRPKQLSLKWSRWRTCMKNYLH